MAQNMKLSIITPEGENFIITINSNETFQNFQEKLLNEYNLKIGVEEFRVFDENLKETDNFFDILKNGLNDDELNNLEENPIYEINLLNNAVNENDIKSENSMETDYSSNLDTSLIILNQREAQDYSTILNENIFELEESNENEDTTYNILIDTKNSENDFDLETKMREIHETDDESITDLCRLCMKNLKESDKFFLFDESNLYKMINKSFPIKIIKGDLLPQYICGICFSKVRAQYDFLEIVVDSDKILRQKFRGINGTELNESIESEDEKSPPKKLKFNLIDSETSDFEFEYLEDGLEENINKKTKNCRFCYLIIDNIENAINHCVNEHYINDLYACIFCEYGFENQKLLSNHINNNHLSFFVKEFRCKVCLKNFNKKAALERHVCDKNKLKQNFTYATFDCRYCVKSFSDQISLEKHLKMHKTAKKHQCPVCLKLFASEEILKEHQTIHDQNKKFQCHICEKKFNRLSRLKTHLLTHTNNLIINDVYTCNVCKVAFKDEEEAFLHETCKSVADDCIIAVKVDRVYRCEFCDKCYSIADNLNQHRKEHNEENPFICQICFQRFSTFSSCASHKITAHSDQINQQDFPVLKHYLCEYCDKSFAQWSHLSTHIKLLHKKFAQLYRCIDCNLNFSTSSSYNYHRKTRHNIDSFNGSLLKNHVATKRGFQCIKCGKVFATQALLEQHVKLHLVNKCPYCPRSFTNYTILNNHIKIHKNLKEIPKTQSLLKSNNQNYRPFVCDECGLAFRRDFILKNHKLKHKMSKESSNFILMVNENNEEDNENEEENSLLTSNNFIQPIMQNQFNLTSEEGNQLQLISEQNAQNFIHGNTVNINGKEYILIQDQMLDNSISDETETSEFVNAAFLPQEENVQQFQNTIMVQPTDDPYIISDNQTETTIPITVTAHGTTYIIGNEFMLDPNSNEHILNQ